MGTLVALDRFQGMFPDVFPHNLPEFGAEEARNCDLRGGGIRALRATLPDAWGGLSGDNLKGDLGTDDVFEMPVAAVPTLNGAVEVMATPSGTVNDATHLLVQLQTGDAAAVVHLQYRCENQDVATVDVSGAAYCNVQAGAVIWDQPNIIRVPYTMDSFRFGFNSVESGVELNLPVMPLQYKITGPSFRVLFKGNAANGHPSADVTLGVAGPGLPSILGGYVPIKRDNITVGWIRCVDVRIETFAKTVDVAEGTTDVTDYIPQTSGELIFQVNFLHDREQIRYYAAAMLYEETQESGEIAETIGPLGYRDAAQIIVGEGERPVLKLEWTGTPVWDGTKGCRKIRVFRSAEVAGGWRKVQDVLLSALGPSGSLWTDEIIALEGQGVDLFGNAPAGMDLTKTVLHPAGFGAALVGNIVRYTAPLALHVWPEEYQTELPEGETGHFGLVGLGNGIVAFMAAGVYWLSGGSPGSMGWTRLTDKYLLLAAKSLFREGGRLTYISNSGPVTIGAGGDLRLLTAGLVSEATFQSAAWYDTENKRKALITRQHDGMVWFGTATAGHVLEPQGDGVALVEYDYGANAGKILWRGRKWLFDTPRNLAELLFTGTLPADLTLITDKGSANYEAANGSAQALWDAMGGYTGVAVRRIQVQVEDVGGAIGVERIVLLERVPIPVNGPVRITPGMVGPDGTCWLQFQGAGRFRGGVLYAKAGGGTVRLTTRAWTSDVATPNEFETATPTDSTWFNLTAAATSDEWRLEIPLATAPSWDSLLLFPEERIEIPATGFSRRGKLELAIQNIVLAFPESGRFSVARIWATPAAVTLILTNVATGVSYTYAIAGSGDVVLSDLLEPDAEPPPAREWRLRIMGADEVHGIDLVGEACAILEGGSVRLERGAGPVTWLGRRIYSPRAVSFRVARVGANVYAGLKLRLFREGSLSYLAEDGGAEVEIADGNCFLLPRLEPAWRWRVDLAGADATDMVELVRLGTSMAGLG